MPLLYRICKLLYQRDGKVIESNTEKDLAVVFMGQVPHYVNKLFRDIL